MLGPEHGNTHVRIGKLRKLLGKAFDLVAEGQAHGKSRVPIEQIDRPHRGFNGRNFVSLLAQLLYCHARIRGMLPMDQRLGAECRFANPSVWRPAGEPTQVELSQSSGISRAKKRADIIYAANVYENGNHRKLPHVIIYSRRPRGAIGKTLHHFEGTPVARRAGTPAGAAVEYQWRNFRARQ